MLNVKISIEFDDPLAYDLLKAARNQMKIDLIILGCPRSFIPDVDGMQDNKAIFDLQEIS